MPAQNKLDMLEKISASLENSKGVFVIDYRGLSVKETQELRRALRAAHSEMKVYKNNIVKIALKNAGMPEIDDMLAGTCAYVFFENDPVDAAKVIKEEAKKLKKLEYRKVCLCCSKPAFWYCSGYRRARAGSCYRTFCSCRSEKRCVVWRRSHHAVSRNTRLCT